MPPAVPLSKFLAPTKASWADDEAEALPAFSGSSAERSAPPLSEASPAASRGIPAQGPYVVFVGNVPYEIQASDVEDAFRDCGVRTDANAQPNFRCG
jgi:hypothetical protein